MLADAERAAAQIPDGDGRVARAKVAGAEFAAILRPALFPEDDDG